MFFLYFTNFLFSLLLISLLICLRRNNLFESWTKNINSFLWKLSQFLWLWFYNTTAIFLFFDIVSRWYELFRWLRNILNQLIRGEITRTFNLFTIGLLLTTLRINLYFVFTIWFTGKWGLIILFIFFNLLYMLCLIIINLTFLNN